MRAELLREIRFLYIKGQNFFRAYKYKTAKYAFDSIDEKLFISIVKYWL